MKAFALLSLTALLFAANACSDNEAPAGTTGQHAISFNALASKQPRSAATTTASLKSFVVYAFTGSKPLMEGVTVSRNGGLWTYSPTAYWPETPVNFYAFSPDISNSSQITGIGSNSIPDFINNGNIDLLYAVNIGEYEKPAPVAINFRHAFAKVDVMMSSSNVDIQVKVSHVSLCNIYTKGTFLFPQATTSPENPEAMGSWTDLSANQKILTFYAIDNESQVTLTSNPVNITEGTLDTQFFLPQELTKVELAGNDYIGNFIQIDCEIYDTSSGAKLWPKSDTPSYMLVPHTDLGRLIFPLMTTNVEDWKMGYSYVYNIAINNPAVLDAIEFEPTVDEYAEINP